MQKQNVFMFSGQGSQTYHMGRDLYYGNPVFRHWMLKLDSIIKQFADISVICEIYDEGKSKANTFNRLLFTHPAIFMVEYSLAQVLISLGIEPDYVLGASLGEFTSAAVSGIVSVDQILELILKQAEMIESQCEPGSMIAVIDNPDIYRQLPAMFLHSELAAINYDSHFIVSGNAQVLVKVKEQLRNSNVVFQVLPVEYGFHSASINQAESNYKELLRKYSFKKPQVSLISSMLGQAVGEVGAGYFWDIIRQPFNFQQVVCNLETMQFYNYIDVGPSGTLANFVKKNLKPQSSSQVYAILNPFGHDIKRIEKIKELCK